MTVRGPLPFIDPGQQMLPGMGPMAGERYRQRNTGAIAAVIRIDQRRYGWITVRIHGQEGEVRTDRFLEYYERIT